LDGGVRTEQDEDQPVSGYGESKRGGELAVLEHRERIPSVILRPPLVYGPRDRGVLAIAQVAARGLMPLVASEPAQSGPKRYSQIFGEDLARGIVEATLTDRELASGSRYYLASSEIVSEAEMYQAFADAFGKKLTRLTIPAWTLKGLAAGADLAGKVLGKSFMLNGDKVPELLAPAWTCSHVKAERELGFKATTAFKDGIRQTAEWYRSQGWVN
jgi:nucleoside-diphosphate-sugar epimerase